MKTIYINGLGVHAYGTEDGVKLCERVIREETEPVNSGKISFESAVKPSKLRRCSRYTKMAVSAAAMAAAEGKIKNPEETGTILATGYGAVESNISFADSVVKGDPALCSPATFANTVPNSCVGQICIVQGYKGYSTMLTGGDPLEYATLLLRNQKAENIICGGVEEYNEELKSAVMRSKILSDTMISEAAAMLCLSAEKTESTYCKIKGFASASLYHNPYLYQVNKESAARELRNIYSRITEFGQPDLILTQDNGTYFDEIERDALKEYFGEDIAVTAPKKKLGETLGCGYVLNTAVGASILRDGEQKDIHTVLATGIDMHGNYLTVLLEESKRDFV